MASILRSCPEQFLRLEEVSSPDNDLEPVFHGKFIVATWNSGKNMSYLGIILPKEFIIQGLENDNPSEHALVGKIKLWKFTEALHVKDMHFQPKTGFLFTI